MSEAVVELEHESPRIGRVRFDPRQQLAGREDVVRLEIVREGRVGLFKRELVRPKLRRIEEGKR